jgi:putative oxidoreductase
VLEVVGGTLILLGLFTRPVAFILAGEMAFAYFMGHASQGHFLWPVLNQGALAVIYCFLFLYFSSAGPGPWSLDALRERRRSSASPPL